MSDTRVVCPPPQCPQCHRSGEGHIAPRSGTGTHKHREQLCCTACDREGSAQKGTLMARSKRPAHTVIRMGLCQRWGVCDAGTADMCAVDRKTVHCVQHVAADPYRPAHGALVSAGAQRCRQQCWKTVGWHTARPSGASAAPHPLSIAESPAIGDGTGGWGASRTSECHIKVCGKAAPPPPSPGHRADRSCVELSGVSLASRVARSGPETIMGGRSHLSAAPGLPRASWRHAHPAEAKEE